VRDRARRNCNNRLGLSDEARAVDAYTPGVRAELEESGAKKVFRLGDIRLYECPLSYLTLDTAELMRLVYLIDGSGRLLHAGGWGAQPFWLVEAYGIYKSEAVKEVKDKSNG